MQQVYVTKVTVSSSLVDPLRLTFPVKGGVILHPFQLEHAKSISQPLFYLKDSFHKMLLQRNDLELQFSCFHNDDKQGLCNWPSGVSVSINDTKLNIDRVSHCMSMYILFFG